jgi:hypothetical protein
MPKGLTDCAVKNAEPKEKKYKLYDSAGLFLIIAPSGGKWWRFKYRFDGREKQLSLGTHPKVSLTEARVLRDNARQLIKKGFDPSEIRKAEKAERKQAEGVTMPSVRCMMDGVIEIWKGTNVMRLSTDEARFVTKQLSALTEERHAID